MTEQLDFESERERYVQHLLPAFFPENMISNDVILYIASLLRIVGMEDGGWDPHVESRGTLDDLDHLLRMSPLTGIADEEKFRWRIGLLLYGHIVEMDAPYEVLTNLLRVRLGYGYNPNPYYQFLRKDEQKRYARVGIYPARKIELIKHLCKEASLTFGACFDEFFRPDIRNAVGHSDYIITANEFRCRHGHGVTKSFKLALEDLNNILLRARAFASAFLLVERGARQALAEHRNVAMPYDVRYKGLLEVLTDEEGLLCGFKVHWPNGCESAYSRSEREIDMSNCMLSLSQGSLEMFVGEYAREPGTFSPLVEKGADPFYSSLADGSVPSWPDPTPK